MAWRTGFLDTLDRFRTDMNRLLYPYTDPYRATTGLRTWRPVEPAVNVYESPETFLVRMEVPGADRESLDVTLTRGNLTVRGRYAERSEEGTLIRAERARGRFTRTIPVSRFADREKVEANYRDGVLLVQVPKTKEAMPKRIEVKS